MHLSYGSGKDRSINPTKLILFARNEKLSQTGHPLKYHLLKKDLSLLNKIPNLRLFLLSTITEPRQSYDPALENGEKRSSRRCLLFIYELDR